jgi:hypothetical protein
MDIYSIKKNEDGFIGYALIVNNNAFISQKTGEPAPRHGSEIDVRNIKRTLEKLNFKVNEPIVVDLTALDMKIKFNDLAKNVDFGRYKCFVCVLMSHGASNGEIYGIDWKSVRLDEDIIDPFRECEQLRGKPKLFFVQACRGIFYTHVKEFEGDDTMMHDNNTNDIHFQIEEDKFEIDNEIDVCNDGEGDMQTSKQRAAKEGDILVHRATVERYVSVRNINEGSCFILSLCHVLDNYALLNELYDLNHLVTMINSHVTNVYKCQQPSFESSLNKFFYFNPDNAVSAVKKTENNDSIQTASR